MASLPDMRTDSGRAPTRSARKRPPVPLAMVPEWVRDAGPRKDRPERTQFRTVFVSDFHLGTAGCNAAMLVDFLRSMDCETLYLVGDIVDGWQLKKGWYWPQPHNEVVRCILKIAKTGTRVVYIPGNHDDAFRDYVGLDFGGVELLPEDIHETADGRRLLVLHGDEFDNVVRYARWLAFLGDHAYTLLLKSNGAVNAVRRALGMPYWSLAAHMKKRVKNAVQFVSRFEEAVAHAAADRGVEGVVCGHIHTAEIRRFGDITYYNDGDWVESCTALVEHGDGRMEIIDWAEKIRNEARAQVRSRPREVIPA